MTAWKTIGPSGYWGPDRARKTRALDAEYGDGRWRVIHVWDGSREQIIPRSVALALYEDAYYQFLRDNSDIRCVLQREARDVFVFEEQDVVTGRQGFPETLDYSIQEARATHLQDIAVRRALLRLGVFFEGKRLICVRGGSADEVGRTLSPAHVPFHLPHFIRQPPLKGWWEPGSVACYYHSNKLLQVLEA